jgi:hypothetical protein
MRAELLLGCGSSRVKKIAQPEHPDWSGLVTLDFADTHKPDVVHDIASLPLPFPDDSFDEIHAYEVMEHVGQQGDWKFFFGQWSDIWRILKLDGLFIGTSPHWSSAWAWGDPGHTRVISQECLVFLHQPNYQQVGITPMTDYRFCYKADFDIAHIRKNEAEQLEFVLKAVKPSRVAA